MSAGIPLALAWRSLMVVNDHFAGTARASRWCNTDCPLRKNDSNAALARNADRP